MTEPSAGLEQEETEHDVDLIHECVVKMAKEISDFMDISGRVRVKKHIRMPCFCRIFSV